MKLRELYPLWDSLCDLPVDDDLHTLEPILHFPAGTPREDIWHWFEAQNKLFVVGDIQQGKRQLIGDFSHAFDIAFSVITDNNDESVTADELRAGLARRLAEISDDELLEACGAPFDTCEGPDE